VTFWQTAVAHPPAPTAADLGALLRRLHELDVPEELNLPEFDPFGRSARRLAHPSSSVKPADVAFLKELFDQLEKEVADLKFALPPCAVHGDAHPGNLIRGADGQVIMIDFEAFCFGPPEWDLSLTASYRYTLDWLDDASYQAFAEAYGYDVTDWDGWSTLRRVREFTMTTWIMQLVDDPAAAREFAHRMDDLRTGRLPRLWRPF
jgi:aminoglycoside phosphotransferase (APT) family kinase protein